MAHRGGVSRALAAGLLAASVCLGPSAAAADEAAERARIDTQRAQANTALADRERACLAQFLVAPCMDTAHKEQRAVLTRLRKEEIGLDQTQRNVSAAQRRQILADKAATRQARFAAADSEVPQRAAAEAASAASGPAGKKWRSHGDAASPAPTHADDASRRAAFEAQNAAAFESRARAVQEHREAVLLRNARRMEASGSANKRSAPLPAPAAASRPASAP